MSTSTTIASPALAATTTGTGPDVVLLHGIPGSARSWDAVAAGLAADHRVTVPDLLGFGRSPRPREAAQLWATAQADALEATLERIGVERAIVAGHDFGGPVALWLAARRPDRVAGLVLAATNAFPDTPIPFPLSATTWPLVGPVARRALFSEPSLRLMLRQGTGTGGAGGPAPDTALGDAAQRGAIATIFGDALAHLADRYAPLEEILREIDVPVRVIWGDRDPFFPVAQAERTARTAADGRALVVHGAGHFLPDERPAELAAAIRELALELT